MGRVNCLQSPERQLRRFRYLAGAAAPGSVSGSVNTVRPLQLIIFNRKERKEIRKGRKEKGKHPLKLDTPGTVRHSPALLSIAPFLRQYAGSRFTLY